MELESSAEVFVASGKHFGAVVADIKEVAWYFDERLTTNPGVERRQTTARGAFLTGRSANPGFRLRGAERPVFGTLGCWFRSLEEEGAFLLSCSHLLPRGMPGDNLQFSRNGVIWSDGAEVRTLSRIQWDEVCDRASNRADGLSGALVPGFTASVRPVCGSVQFSGRLLSKESAPLKKVSFCGALSKPGNSQATGTVEVVNATVTLFQGKRSATFIDQFLIGSDAVPPVGGSLVRGPLDSRFLFAAPGDSGSLVVVSDKDDSAYGDAVGLLVGWFVQRPTDREPLRSYFVVTPIETVFDELGFDPDKVIVMG